MPTATRVTVKLKVKHGLRHAASCKVSLKDDAYRRQLGRTVGVCTLIVQGTAVVLVVTSD